MFRKNVTVRMFLTALAALLALAIGTGNAVAYTDGTWILDNSANWSNNTTAWQSNQVADGAGATAAFDTVIFSGNWTVTLDTDRTIGILKLGNDKTSGSKGLTIGPAGTSKLILNGNGSDAQVTFRNGGQNANINVPTELKSNLLITNSDTGGNKGFFFSAGLSSSNGNLTITNTSHNNSRTKFNSTVSDGTAGNSITFLQTAGWAEFNNANTFTGSTTIQDGIIILGNSQALQDSALGITFNGTASTGLRIVGTGVTTLTLGGLTGNKNFAATGGVFSTASGNYSQVTALTLNPGTGKSYSYDGAIANGSANMTLTKTGAGTQTLNGANTYTGTTSINAGTLQAGVADGAGNGALGNGGAITFGGGTLQYTAASAGTDWAGRFGSSASPIKLDTNGRTVTLNNAIVATNTGGLILNDTATTPGTLVLGGSNLYTGGTTVTNGTLRINNANALLAGQDLTIGAGGTVLLDSNLAASAANGAALSVNAVPEPGTVALLAAGLAGLLAAAWRRRR